MIYTTELIKYSSQDGLYLETICKRWRLHLSIVDIHLPFIVWIGLLPPFNWKLRSKVSSELQMTQSDYLSLAFVCFFIIFDHFFSIKHSIFFCLLLPFSHLWEVSCPFFSPSNVAFPWFYPQLVKNDMHSQEGSLLKQKRN